MRGTHTLGGEVRIKRFLYLATLVWDGGIGAGTGEIPSTKALVITPARVDSEGGSLQFYVNTLTKDKLIKTSDQTSALIIRSLDDLEIELYFYGGHFLHKGRIKEEMAEVDRNFGKHQFEWELRGLEGSIRQIRRDYAHLKKAEIDQKPAVRAAEARRDALIQRGPESAGLSLWYYGATGAVSPDGTYFYCYQTDRTEPKELWQSYWVFDVKTETRRPSTFNFRGKIDQPWRISPDGTYGLVRTGDLDLVLCDPLTGEIKKNFKYPWLIENVYFSQDSKYLVLIGGEAWIYEIESGKRMGTLFINEEGRHRKGLFKGEAWPGKYAEFSPSGRYLFHRAYTTAGGIGGKPWTATLHSTHVIWDWRRDRLVESLPKEALMRFEGWGPTDDLVLIAEPDHVAVVHLPTGRVVAKLMQPPGFRPRLQPLTDRHRTHARSMCRPSDGVVLSDGQGADGFYRLIRWDLGPHMDEIRKRVATLPGKP